MRLKTESVNDALDVCVHDDRVGGGRPKSMLI
jgi:hypothetical protein